MSKDPSFETVEFEAADNSTQEFPKAEETDTTLVVAEPQHKTTASTSADGYVTSAHTTVDNPRQSFVAGSRGAPPVKWLAILLGLALIALACVAWRDVWISYTNSPQTLWSAPVFRLIGTPPLPMWMVWAGVASMVVGLIFFIIAVRPGRMTHVPVSSSTEDGATTMWIRNVDIARLVSGTTRRIPGVSTAQTRTTGNTKKGLKVEITIAGDVDDPMLAQRVSDSAKHALKELGTKVDVSVEVEKKQELGNNV